MLCVLSGVHGALALTESLIAGGCAGCSIFLLMAHEHSASPMLQNNAALKSVGEHRGISVYCVDHRHRGREPVFDQSAQQRRFAHLIARFAEHFPVAWELHHDLVKEGSPVGVVHLEEPLDDEPAIARTVLAHSIRRVQISDLPTLPTAD